MHKATSSGVCPNDLAIRNSGKMAHSRWLTTYNRIIRLYVSSEDSTVNVFNGIIEKKILSFAVKLIKLYYTV